MIVAGFNGSTMTSTAGSILSLPLGEDGMEWLDTTTRLGGGRGDAIVAMNDSGIGLVRNV